MGDAKKVFFLVSWWNTLFENLCHKWISARDTKKCGRSKKITLFVGQVLTGLIAIVVSLSPNYEVLKPYILGLIISFLVVFAISFFVELGFEHVNDVIDEEIKNGLVKVQQKQASESFWHNLVIEYGLLMTEMVSVLKQLYKDNNRDISKLFTKMTESIVQMLTDYCKMDRKDFAIHLYMFDKPTQQIQRVKQMNFCESVMSADENQPHTITRGKKYYYETNIIKKKSTATFSLVDNDAIQVELVMDNLSDDIKKLYSQYMALKQDFGKSITLYAEIISFNGVRFGETKEDLETVIRRTITPMFKFISSIDWDDLRRNTEYGEHSNSKKKNGKKKNK